MCLIHSLSLTNPIKHNHHRHKTAQLFHDSIHTLFSHYNYCKWKWIIEQHIANNTQTFFTFNKIIPKYCKIFSVPFPSPDKWRGKRRKGMFDYKKNVGNPAVIGCIVYSSMPYNSRILSSLQRKAYRAFLKYLTILNCITPVLLSHLNRPYYKHLRPFSTIIEDKVRNCPTQTQHRANYF